MNKRKTLIQKLKSQLRRQKKIIKECNLEYVARLENNCKKLKEINLKLANKIRDLEKELIPKSKEKFFKRIWNAIKGI